MRLSAAWRRTPCRSPQCAFVPAEGGSVPSSPGPHLCRAKRGEPNRAPGRRGSGGLKARMAGRPWAEGRVSVRGILDSSTKLALARSLDPYEKWPLGSNENLSLGCQGWSERLRVNHAHQRGGQRSGPRGRKRPEREAVGLRRGPGAPGMRSAPSLQPQRSERWQPRDPQRQRWGLGVPAGAEVHRHLQGRKLPPPPREGVSGQRSRQPCPPPAPTRGPGGLRSASPLGARPLSSPSLAARPLADVGQQRARRHPFCAFLLRTRSSFLGALGPRAGVKGAGITTGP